jgi:hypothetical protein
MAAGRAVAIAIIILALAVSPLAVPLLGGSSPSDATAYAALVGGGKVDRVQAPALDNNDNDDDDDDDNDNDGGGDDNDNNGDDDDDDDNDNGDDDDDDDDDNDNGGDDNDNGGDGNDNVRVVVRHPNESVNRPTKCFDAREVGVVQLGTGSYDVTATVMPHSSFNQTTRLTLKKVDAPGAISGGTLVDSVVYELRAQSSCDGVDIGTLPNLVNLGITYNVVPPVDKAKLQIVRWTGSAWENIATVPDPVAGNPYVSATISMAGTYALIQVP